MRPRTTAGAAACLLLVLAAGKGLPLAAAEEGPSPWRAALVLSREQGDFGTGTEQTLTDLAASIAYRAGAGGVRLTLPYLWLESGGEAAQGAGDLRLDGWLRVLRQAGRRPALRAVAALKLPTADGQAGLGTGEADLTLGLAADAFLSDDAFWFADADYTLIGHTEDNPLQNQWRLSAGAGSYLSGALVLSAALDGRSPAYAGEVAPLSLVLGLAREGPIGWQVSLKAGLSDTAADLALAFGLSTGF